MEIAIDPHNAKQAPNATTPPVRPENPGNPPSWLAITKAQPENPTPQQEHQRPD